MGVYIKNMEMPKSCAFCRFYGAYCYAKGDEDVHSTLPCPLVPVPPHGRLIDADALKASIAFAEKTAEWAVPALRAVLMVIDEMPTIIEEER